MMPIERPAREAQITSPDRARRLIDDLGHAMDGLLEVLKEETDLVRAGRLRQARELAQLKNDRAAVYTRLMLLARDEVEALGRFMPGETEALKHRHEFFRAEVQINLAVLATARDVAEDLVRQAANDAGGASASGYGQTGRAAAGADPARGFALNRNF